MLKFDKLRFYLQAIRTVLWARKCSLFTTMITSVRMSLLRRRFRFRRTSLACRVNWIQLSVADVIFAPILKHKEKRKKATFKGRIYNTRTSFQVKALRRMLWHLCYISNKFQLPLLAVCVICGSVNLQQLWKWWNVQVQLPLLNQ